MFKSGKAAGASLPMSVALSVFLLTAFVAMVHPWHVRLGFFPSSPSQPLRRKLLDSVVVPQANSCQPHNKCIFVVSTGRSGSTNLQDALNQVPGVLVRGENDGLFQVIARLSSKVDYVMRQAVAHLTLEGSRERVAADAKEEYEQYIAAKRKTAWVNSWPNGTEQCVAVSLFKQLYGYGPFEEYVVGFKEVRYNAWSGMTTYAALEQHVDFLKGLCRQSKVVLNMRRDAAATAESGHFKDSGSDWEPVLAKAGEWFEKYAAAHPDTLTVYYEDMFDPARNATVARNLLAHLGLPQVDITFARIKGWWKYPKGLKLPQA